jgi:hypothetical protein
MRLQEKGYHPRFRAQEVFGIWQRHIQGVAVVMVKLAAVGYRSVILTIATTISAIRPTAITEPKIHIQQCPPIGMAGSPSVQQRKKALQRRCCFLRLLFSFLVGKRAAS